MRINPRLFALSLLMLFSSPVPADINTDKISGNCAAYLTIQNKTKATELALSLADRQDRALNFAEAWLQQLVRYKNDKAAMQGMAISADSDCRKIGIRPADY